MYEIIKSRLMEGGYTLSDAENRVNYLVAVGQLTPEQAEELRGIALANADVPSAVEADVAEIKQVAAEASVLLAAMRPAVQQVAAETYSDAQIVDAAVLFDMWAAGTAYAAGAVVRYGGMLYRVLTAHTALAHQKPGDTGMLAVYAPVQILSPEDEESGKVLPWVYGETGIKVGDRREYQGVVYEAIQAPGTNIYTPNLVPAIWKAVA